MNPSRWTLVVLVLMALAAGVQLLPGVAIFQPSAVGRLYGVSPSDENLLLLLRHRAVLLAMVGLVLAVGVFVAPLRLFAVGVALLSKLSFLALFALTPSPTPELLRVAKVDAVTSTLLAVAAVLLLSWARAR